MRARAQMVTVRRKRVEAFLHWLGSDVKLASVTRPLAGRYLMESLMRQGRSPKTVRDILSDLSALWSWAVSLGLVELSPWSGLSRSVRGSQRWDAGGARRRSWQPDELKTVLKGIDVKDPAWSMTVVALYTGMRANEIAETKLGDVHEDRIHIPEGKPKAAVRDVPLHPVIRPLVARFKTSSTDGYLISGLKRGG